LSKTTAFGLFDRISTAGYYLAFRIGFAYPMEEHNTLPGAWILEYTRRGLMISDPAMIWVYRSTGFIRWSAIDLPDPNGVFELARTHGLVYGAGIAVTDPDPRGQRSFGSFARSDREFTDNELEALHGELRALHLARLPPGNLTRAELEALRMVKDGLLMKEIAGQLGVSEGAVQQRLKNARIKLNANTSSQAVSMAAAYGLI